MTDGGQPRRIDVPVEVPEGVNHELLTNEVTFRVQLNVREVRVVSEQDGNEESEGAWNWCRNRVPERVSDGAGTGAPVRNAPRRRDCGITYVMHGRWRISTVDATDARSTRQPTNCDRNFIRLCLQSSNGSERKKRLRALMRRGFIRDGKAEVQVWLTEKSDEALAQLKELGFEVCLMRKLRNSSSVGFRSRSSRRWRS